MLFKANVGVPVTFTASLKLSDKRTVPPVPTVPVPLVTPVPLAATQFNVGAVVSVGVVGAKDAAGKPGMGVVHLVVCLVAGHPELFGIDDDDEISGIDVRRVDGLVLAAQTEGDFTGHPAENLVGCVNHKPLMRHFGCFCAEGFHGSRS